MQNSNRSEMTPQPFPHVTPSDAASTLDLPIPLINRKEIPTAGTFGPSTDITRRRPILSGAKFPVIVAGSGVSNASFMRQSRGTAFTPKQHAERVSVRELNDMLGLWQRFLNFRRVAARTEPNAAHRAIGQFIDSRTSGIVLDLNTDGLLQQVATDRIFQLRGSIWRNRCRSCGFKYVDTQRDVYDPQDRGRYYAPMCRRCRSYMRPDVLVYDEPIMPEHFKNLLEYGQAMLSTADVILLVGITEEDYPSPLFDALRPDMKRRSGEGFAGDQYLIEATNGKPQFISDSPLIGKLEHTMTYLLALP